MIMPVTSAAGQLQSPPFRRPAVRWILALGVIVAPGITIPPLALAQAIEMEVLFDRTAPLGAAQQWTAVLGRLGVSNLRMRQSERPQPSVERSNVGGTPIIRVVGSIGRSGELLVPGGKFTRTQSALLADWLEQTRKGTAEQPAGGTSRKQGAERFGLSAEEFAAVRKELAAEVRESTKDQPLLSVLQSISGPLELDLQSTPTLSQRLRQADKVADELQGLASGTALAAALHSAGLGMVPTRQPTGRMVWQIRSAEEGNHWPVGWPVAEQSIREVAPKLFDFVKIDVFDQPAGEVLEALRPRLEIPLLFDRRAMAQDKIELNTTKVNFTRTKVYYLRVLNHVLYSARLKGLVRIDEAGQGLVWITTLRPPATE